MKMKALGRKHAKLIKWKARIWDDKAIIELILKLMPIFQHFQMETQKKKTLNLGGD